MKKIVTLFKDKNFRRTFVIVVLLIVAAVAYVIFQKTTGRVFIDNSLIQSPVITVSPSASG